MPPAVENVAGVREGRGGLFGGVDLSDESRVCSVGQEDEVEIRDPEVMLRAMIDEEVQSRSSLASRYGFEDR